MTALVFVLLLLALGVALRTRATTPDAADTETQLRAADRGAWYPPPRTEPPAPPPMPPGAGEVRR